MYKVYSVSLNGEPHSFFTTWASAYVAHVLVRLAHPLSLVTVEEATGVLPGIDVNWAV